MFVSSHTAAHHRARPSRCAEVAAAWFKILCGSCLAPAWRRLLGTAGRRISIWNWYAEYTRLLTSAFSLFKLTPSLLLYLLLKKVEIYNETVVDLLDGGKRVKLEVRQDGAGGSVVHGLARRTATTEEDVLHAFRDAVHQRATKQTRCNSRSSRSHFVLMLKIDQTKSGQSRNASLQLVDLAGSERLGRSGAAADPSLLRETQAINKSLAALGNVISAVSRGDKHVPFRDSKLTHVLQRALQKDSQTLMICNVGMEQEQLTETVRSLQFASRVNQTKLR